MRGGPSTTRRAYRRGVTVRRGRGVSAWHTRTVTHGDPPARRTPSAPRHLRVRPGAFAVTLTLALMVTGCGSADEGSDAERFCGEIGADPMAIVAPGLADEDELTATVERYQMLAELAPVAIEASWRAVLRSLETATTVVPGDPESVQRAVTQAYASERAAVEVRDWVLANCGVDLGPVSTITPHGPSVTIPQGDEEEPVITREEPAGQG